MELPHLWRLFGQDHMPYRLLLLARMIDRESSRELQRHGLSLAEWRVLAIVGTAGPSSASRLGELGQIDRAEISRAVARLASKGLIARRADDNHRRRFIISLTEAGEGLFTSVRDERRRFFSRMMEGLSTPDREAMDKCVETMALNLIGD